MHLGRSFADADGQHRSHASLPRAPQHYRAVVRVALAVNVGVGIDQQEGLGGDCMENIIVTGLILWQWQCRWMHHAKPQVLLERVEIAIVMEEFVALLNTESGNQAIYGAPNGDTKPTQGPIIPGRLDSELIASNFKDCKLAQCLQRSCKPGIVTNSLQDFRQNQAGDPDASKADLCIKPLRLRIGVPPQVVDQYG